MTIIQTLPAVSSVVYKAIRKDRSNRYGLVQAVDYGTVRTTRFKAFDFDNGVLQFIKEADDAFEMLIKPFTPESEIWDGTSNLPDGGTRDLDALLRASLGHDTIYKFAEQLAKAGNTTVEAILAFADDFFKISSDANGCSPKVSKVIYHVLRNLGMLYHKAMKVLTLVAITVCPACVFENPSDFTSIEFPAPPIVWEFNGKTNSWNAVECPTNTVDAPVIETVVETNSPPIVVVPPAPAFLYESFGNPSTSKCVEDPETQIKDLKMNGNGLSYKWEKGNLRNWGVKDDHDHNGALAIAGWRDRVSGKWRFAKFDWISTDRLTRDFENIHGHYNGFDPDAFFNAPERGFFIMSADGRKRTNILTCK